MSDDAEMAIAIKYDKEKDTAPRVVAKGMRLKAEKIREIARQYNIPVMRNVSLANALYRIDVGQEIPEELYDAVAEVLNFIFELQREQQASGKR
ncbi:EscU/YscU/HrcU family type III secretion system export apparatus switch protein [Archangium violaceum]|uniref:Flagellar biosynthesis protein FlhB n=1 Tax=Archangium violaceum Cb vi76 TaxID=1406225 RepID=A0A084SM62_9BACT|nr:EscU/YscU/HrcU family type III secretion system export apparatus switch protein [Archangium violaceum]KFA89547.1 flagellar biosynthesis protein FlhB [Archangium violaceum Cb vi76]